MTDEKENVEEVTKDSTTSAVATKENTAPGTAAARESAKASRRGFEDPRLGIRTFRCPRAESQKFLVERGPDQDIRNELKRLDIYAEFSLGTCQTRDPRVIDFLEAHAILDADDHNRYHAGMAAYFEAREQYDMSQAHLNRLDSCSEFNAFRDADDPMCEAWFDVESRKREKVNAYASLPSDYNLEDLLKGQPGSRQQVRRAGRSGSR